LFKLL